MKRRTKIGIGCISIPLIPILFLIGLAITEKIQMHISQTKATQAISQLVPKDKQLSSILGPILAACLTSHRQPPISPLSQRKRTTNAGKSSY